MSATRRFALAALLAAGLCAAACGGDDAAEDGYLSETVDRGAITATVTATGTVQPVSKVQVGTYVSGPIQEIYVDFNSPVTSGQLVAKIDPAPFAVKVRQAEANLANSRASVEKARADLQLKRLTLERNRSLRTRDLISQDELDTSVSNEAQAAAQVALEEAGVKQAAAGLEEARITLGYTAIRSPVDGVVISRSVEVGQTVAASFQTPTLFEIAQDLTKMQVNANVSESDIGGLHEGQTARFGVDAYPGRAFEGRVTQVRNAPITVLNVVTYDVIIEVDNREFALKPGMTATVTITTAQREDALRVPLRALRFRPESDGEVENPPPAVAAGRPDAGAAAVYVLDGDSELRRVELRTGLRDERWAEVVEGELAPGSAVAVAYRRPPRSEDARALALRAGAAPVTPMAEALIEVRDLCRTYELGETQLVALENVTLSIARGEFVAVMGASGSGKSTLMNLLGCLDTPTSGSYRLAGRDVAGLSSDERATIRNREIGFVFQNFNLVPRTSALENVELPLVYGGVAPAEQRERARAALRSVGLEGRDDNAPSQLSGGQQQRVAIARALINRPLLLLADEPTGNLDSRTSVEILALFQRLNRDDGITIVVVTHETDIAGYAGRVVTFRDGRVIADVRQTPAVAREEDAA